MFVLQGWLMEGAEHAIAFLCTLTFTLRCCRLDPRVNDASVLLILFLHRQPHARLFFDTHEHWVLQQGPLDLSVL